MAEEYFVYSYSGRVWAYTKASSGLVGIIFLILTITAFAKSPDQRTVHGKTSMAHFLCLLMSYVFHSLVQLVKEYVTKDVCVIIDVTWMYFGLSSFFWLHVMSFDVWRSFRRNMYVIHRQNHSKVFSYYCLYAVSTPTILLAFSIYFDFASATSNVTYTFCVRSYWTVQFFLMPVFIMLVCNLGFFISTSLRIREIESYGKELFQSEDCRIHNKLERKRFKTYLKLFAVTGGSWCVTMTATVIAFVLVHATNVDISSIDHLLSCIGAMIGLQSISIFIACVWATDLRNILLHRLLPAKFNQKFHRGETENNTTVSCTEPTKVYSEILRSEDEGNKVNDQQAQVK